MVYWFNWNFISIFCKLLDRFGFFISELFKDIFLKWVDELNIILMDFGFLGWYILNIGRYYFFILFLSIGVFFVCFLLNNFIMNFLICLYFLELCWRFLLNVFVCCSVWVLLFGRCSWFCLNGRGVI